MGLRWYINFLNLTQKHRLWILIRSASSRRLWWAHTIYVWIKISSTDVQQMPSLDSLNIAWYYTVNVMVFGSVENGAVLSWQQTFICDLNDKISSLIVTVQAVPWYFFPSEKMSHKKILSSTVNRTKLCISIFNYIYTCNSAQVMIISSGSV